MPSTHDRCLFGPAWFRPTANAFVWLAATLLLPAGAMAQNVRLLVQSSPLAGFRYHEAPQWFGELRAGDELTLKREPDNPHDGNAVRVEWKGHMLGYVPRTQNTTLAWALDRGDPVSARISHVRVHRNPRQRVEFEVFVD